MKKNKGGRPGLYRTEKALEKKIEKYEQYCKREEIYPTISGLCHYLGFASRQSFYDLEKDDRFSYTIKRARLWIESIYEQGLHRKSSAGCQFALKNFGWKDVVDNHILPPPDGVTITIAGSGNDKKK